MINLTNPTADVVKLVTSTTADIDVHASWVDNGASTVTPGRTNTKTTTATTTTIVAAPGASTQRNLKSLVISNIHATTSNTVTVNYVENTPLTVQLMKLTLFAGESLVWDENVGWRVYDASGQLKIAGTVRPATNDFRLTGVTLTPVMIADSSSLSTIYMSPFKGQQIALYDGANWQLVSTPEISLAVTGRTTDLPFDIFIYLSGATPTLEFLDWTSATARATALVRQDGVWCKTGQLTRRYLGTCRPRSATTYHWVTQGDGATAPTKLDLWNVDNRIEVAFKHVESTDTWTYTTATIRQARGSTNNQIDIVAGLQEECISLDLHVTSLNSTISIAREVGIGYDSTTVFTSVTASTANTVASVNCDQNAKLCHLPAIGRHFYSWNEISTATGTCTWVGDNAAARTLSGMSGTWCC